VKWNASAANRFSLGQAYINTGRYSDAESQFNQVQSLEPHKPNGYYGLGQTYAREGRYNDAVNAFKKAIDVQQDFYDAYAEMAYAYVDSGQMDEANQIHDLLKDEASDLAATVSSYIYQVAPPKIDYAYAYSSFIYGAAAGTQVSALDAYLATANASKTFNMVFQFDKEMDRESVESLSNWRISRAMGSGPGGLYNFGLAIPSTEVQIDEIPINVYYDAEKQTATVSFNVRQNAAADGTVDPSHIQFAFSGKDAFGVKIDAKADQFCGFSGIA
jgi:tetratricopeptide (TPR) repeat protein